jgi:hypothetical protein
MRGEIVKNKEAKYQEFKGIWKNYTRALVMKKLKIKYPMYLAFMTRVIEENRVDRLPPEIYKENEPFSQDEDDYATHLYWGPKLENEEIKKKEATRLEEVIAKYKLTFKK